MASARTPRVPVVASSGAALPIRQRTPPAPPLSPPDKAALLHSLGFASNLVPVGSPFTLSSKQLSVPGRGILTFYLPTSCDENSVAFFPPVPGAAFALGLDASMPGRLLLDISVGKAHANDLLVITCAPVSGGGGESFSVPPGSYHALFVLEVAPKVANCFFFTTQQSYIFDGCEISPLA
jgi:hypothetical protein